MKPIRLDCPECGEGLELDAGFAGGVCRCSNCGTLMTVPAAAGSGGKAERLMRPEAPGEPVGKVAKSGRGGKPKAGVSGLPVVDGLPGAGTYVTASGKKVDIGAKTKVPVASRRIKAARYGTTAAFVVVMVLVLGAAGYLGYRMVNQTISDPPDTTPVERFVYEPDTAPTALPASNVLGIPVGRETAVIVDLSEGADAWREDVEDVLVAGLFRGPVDRRAVMVVVVNGEGAEAFSRGPRPVEGIDPAALKAFMKSVKSGGDAPLAEAIERVADAGVGHAVVVSGRPVPREAGAAMVEAAGDGLRVEAVMVDGADAVGLDDVVVATQPAPGSEGGDGAGFRNVYARVSAGQMAAWAGEAVR